MRCPVLIGRVSELEELRTAWLAACSGEGSVASIVGPAGIGKSRLVRELMASVRADSLVLVGRAVDGEQVAFRPLAEALLSGLRDAGESALDDLGVFGTVLGRVLFHKDLDQAVGGSAVVLGEAVLRLLRLLAAGRGVLLVLEDLQWADPETLAVVEYLADNCAGERLLLVGTCRDAPGTATDLLERLARRGSARVGGLVPFTGEQVEEMIMACGGALDSSVVESIRERAEGLPLLVEDLLSIAESVAPGALMVPMSFGAATRAMVSALPPVARRCVEAAAVLAERVDWLILPPLIGADESTILAGLRDAVQAGILGAETDGTFSFRHALTRDAIVEGLLPPERAATARRALTVLMSGELGPVDDRLSLVVRLAELAGHRSEAARLLLVSGRRDLATGALVTAEDSLVRALELAGEDVALRGDVAECLAEVLVQAGQPARATEVTLSLLEDLRRVAAEPVRAGTAHLRLARAWAITGSWSEATEQVASARLASDRVTDAAELVSALIALGVGRFDDAERHAQGVLERLGDDGPPELRCEALELLGRLARRHDLPEAERCFAEALRVADEADAPIWRTRALHELSTIDLFSSLRLDRAERAAADAARAGAVALATAADFHRSAIHAWRGEYTDADVLMSRCEETCRALKLPMLAMVLVFRAQVAAERGETDAWRQFCAAAIEQAPNDAHVALATRYAEATHLLLHEERDAALGVLDLAGAGFRQSIDTTSGPPLGAWVVLSTLVRGDAVLNQVDQFPGRHVARWTVGQLGYARSISLGRSGRPEAAADAFEVADRVMTEPVPIPYLWHLGRRLAAEAAMTQGWGEPVRWLREELAHFEQSGHPRVAAACRDLLHRAGHPVHRSSRGDVAAPLRAMGVTSREAEVLGLLGEGLANRDIARRLHISVRTVEKHVERLFTKTGAASRPALVARAARNSW